MNPLFMFSNNIYLNIYVKKNQMFYID